MGVGWGIARHNHLKELEKKERPERIRELQARHAKEKAEKDAAAMGKKSPAIFFLL